MKKFFLISLLNFLYILSAQNITFIYELKYKPNLVEDDFVTKVYYLDVLGKQSVFRSEQDRYSDSLVQKTGLGLGRSPVFNVQFYIKKNLAKMSIIKNINTPLMNDQYYIHITDSLYWQILPDKMKIGNIECQKAVVKYGGRNWTAWFAESIPLQEGPYIFNGLPGQIVKISDENSEYDFTLIKTKKSDKNNMFALRAGKEITWEEFQKMQLDYYNDPYAEIKARNIKYQIGDVNGNLISMDLRTLTKNIQKKLKENNNVIELNKAVQYP
ncbi:hypothetical protein IW15_09545 [Chryseobacterium soli]|uniref:GLPGLI family protein n=1 Tax=Chryseobacterium soli TaxID=445961 RepID=A0A086A8J5_9FLAO|nr:GLPGLI family protein [Chryseobacterium soli]KFF13009.1 hypothetical protein IW15_09545 [Chryseobacterium soli]